MVVNFRTRGINRDIHKLAQTSTLKKKKTLFGACYKQKIPHFDGVWSSSSGIFVGVREEEESAIRKAMGFGFGVVG